MNERMIVRMKRKLLSVVLIITILMSVFINYKVMAADEISYKVEQVTSAAVLALDMQLAGITIER